MIDTIPDNSKELLNQVQEIALLFPEEAVFLFLQAQKMAGKEGVIVDIGAFKGGSAITFALGTASCQSSETIYSIDKFECHPMFPEPELWGLDGKVIKEFKKNIERFGVAEQIVLLIKDSAQVAREWNKPVKLLFYDASIMYDEVKQNIELWVPFIVQDGLMIFHDYSAYPGYGGNLKGAVDDFVKENKDFRLIHHFGETAVIKKL